MASQSAPAKVGGGAPHGRAWVDEADEQSSARAMPAFLQSSHAPPSWLRPDTDEVPKDRHTVRDASPTDDSNTKESMRVVRPAATTPHQKAQPVLSRKRYRSSDLDALLARTEPLLSVKASGHASAVPRVLSLLPLPRDGARTIHWHRNGQIALVGGYRHVYGFHAAGQFVERLFRVDVHQRIEHASLSASGEEYIVSTHQAYTPLLLRLASESVVPLTFLDTRESAIYRHDCTAVAERVGKRKAGSVQSNQKHAYITRVEMNPFRTQSALGDAVALSCGRQVKLGSLSSGSVIAQLHIDHPVADVHFTAPNEVMVGGYNTLCVYDIRHTATFVERLIDDGTMDMTTFNTLGNSIAVGTGSGVVNIYDRTQTEGNHSHAGDAHRASLLGRESVVQSVRGGGGGRGTRLLRPIKVLKNLTTAVSTICFGQNGGAQDGWSASNANTASVMAFSSKAQRAGFRLTHVPEYRVIPSFPAVSMRHEFTQSLTIAPTVPILSVGEKNKVTNYAL